MRGVPGAPRGAADAAAATVRPHLWVGLELVVIVILLPRNLRGSHGRRRGGCHYSSSWPHAIRRGSCRERVRGGGTATAAEEATRGNNGTVPPGGGLAAGHGGRWRGGSTPAKGRRRAGWRQHPSHTGAGRGGHGGWRPRHGRGSGDGDGGGGGRRGGGGRDGRGGGGRRGVIVGGCGGRGGRGGAPRWARRPQAPSRPPIIVAHDGERRQGRGGEVHRQCTWEAHQLLHECQLVTCADCALIHCMGPEGGKWGGEVGRGWRKVACGGKKKKRKGEGMRGNRARGGGGEQEEKGWLARPRDRDGGTGGGGNEGGGGGDGGGWWVQ
ncbi:hypothetical protein I4F81_003087 [Pyropia yezoensis]|uniref:Uncharacterized protein n=1 Tax=Pyropia yezoensis TaxID=2788 RepID=A0ACC3BRD3_PYRYE|nr:hypothetical protein I4F81_003087 [Neopyropia yezoensis]